MLTVAVSDSPSGAGDGVVEAVSGGAGGAIARFCGNSASAAFAKLVAKVETSPITKPIPKKVGEIHSNFHRIFAMTPHKP